MKVMVATNEGQGDEPGDYTWTIEGELVTPVSEVCCSPRTCGCWRGFVGLASSRATTTAVVVDRPDLSEDDLWQALSDALERQGWLASLDADERRELTAEHFEFIRDIGTMFPVDIVLRRRGDHVWRRPPGQAA